MVDFMRFKEIEKRLLADGWVLSRSKEATANTCIP